jgi:hypothetical protein
MKKELGVAFRTDGSSSFEVDKIALHLTGKDIEKIKKASEFLAVSEDIWSVDMPLHGSFSFLNEDGEVVDYWRTDVQYLKVYSEGGVIFYAQGADSGDYLESESFSIKEYEKV